MVSERLTILLPPGIASEERAAIVERARRRGFRHFHVGSGEAFEPRPDEEVVRREGDRLFTEGGPTEGIRVHRVGDADGLVSAVRSVPDGSVVAIEWTGDRLIPLENAIALRGRRHAVWVYAREPREVPGALGALEHGADRVFVSVRSPGDLDALESIVEGPTPSHLEWVTVPVTSVRPGGVGHRVLVDTTSLLAPEEGLLVGSAAAFLFHVTSEADGSRFSRPRPFRVNAGAAHSYVLMADGTTRYLSELEAGDAVLATTPRGAHRSVRVGRVKIERRPVVIVTAQDGPAARTIFLQEAETVRLSTDAGRVATTDATAGISVLGVRLPSARHLGTAIEESIEER
jgi:3-dehydroquinate synthase II